MARFGIGCCTGTETKAGDGTAGRSRPAPRHMADGRWPVADITRDVLAARYRAVIMQERGARLFDEFMAREKPGRLAYRN